MFKTIIEKCKFYFVLISCPKNRESGVLASSVVFGLATALAIGLGISFAWSWKEELGKMTLRGVIWLTFYLSQWAFDFSASLFNSVVVSSGNSITGNTLVIHGWTIVRDFANMFVVLGFVVVGIATILRMREYEAQKTLGPLIIAAILINFSMVICGVAIDVTNVTMEYFLSASGPGGVVEPLRAAVLNPMHGPALQTLSDTDNFPGFLVYGMTVCAFAIVSTMIFLLYGALLLFRPAALMCLVILSPLGIVSWVFAATKPFYTKWRDQLISWSILGIPTAFFLYLAGHLANRTVVGGSPTESLYSFLTVIGFLLIGYTFVFQTGAVGASAITGLVASGGRFASGAVRKGVKYTKAGAKAGAGAAGSRLKETEAGRAVTGGFGRAMERIGIYSEGSTAQKEQKKTKDAIDRAKANYKDNPDRVVRNAQGGGRTTRSEDIEASAIVAAQEGALDMNDARMVAHYQTAAQSGRYSAEEIRKAETRMPELARHNRPAVERIQRNSPTPLTEAEAGDMAVRNTMAGLSVGEIGKLSTNSMNMQFLEATRSKKLNKADADGVLSPQQVAHLKQYTTAGTAQEAEFTNRVNHLTRAGASPEEQTQGRELKKVALAINNL
ncbi:MAG: hypothetical protein WC845_00835 [Candidatus Staskawiczbacteria bacterium]|jgi:hypothetical protein